MDSFLFLLAPICLAFLLVGIHAYLGLHVLQRDVIFVDISLSQVAALGGAVSMWFIHEHDEGNLHTILWSLALCLFASFALAVLRHHEKKISQEALIGITYALANGLLILVMDKLPHGTEHLKTALIGNILFVTWPKVIVTAIVYAIIGIIHYLYQKQFWASSKGQTKSFFWDFLFYFLFSIVITFSTHHAGVLVVFSVLVVPAALACRFCDGLRERLFLSWAIGIIGVILSFYFAYKFDWPAGAAIVSTLAGGFFAVLSSCLVYEKLLPKKQY